MTGVQVGDLDHDGKPDAVSFLPTTVTARNSMMAVQLDIGAAGGLSQITGFVQLAVTAGTATIADVDGDGNPDVIAPGTVDTAGMVQIAIGHGDGTFTPGTPFQLGGNGDTPVLAADVNHDGKLDLITINANTAVVALGHGDGTFAAATTFATNNAANEANAQVAIGDVDGDQNPDLVVITYQGVEVLFGVGDGTFKPPVRQPGSVPGQVLRAPVVLADLDQDGHPDLVGTSANTGAPEVWLNHGGSFREVIDSGTRAVVNTIAVRDVDGDGHPDVIATTDDTLNVLYGDGKGKLTEVDYPAGANLISPVVSDVNGDGAPDIVYVGGVSVAGTVRVLFGSCPAH